MSTKSV